MTQSIWYKKLRLTEYEKGKNIYERHHASQRSGEKIQASIFMSIIIRGYHRAAHSLYLGNLGPNLTNTTRNMVPEKGM